MKKLYILILLFACYAPDVFGRYSINPFTDPSFCGTTYPTSYFTSSFSISEVTINGVRGFKKGQTSKTLILGFSSAIFNFNPGVGSVSASGTEVTINGYTITSTQITVNITTSGSNNQKNTINFTGFQIRATAAGTGFICRTGGTFAVDKSTSIPASTVSWGNLTAGTPYFHSTNSTTNPVSTNVFVNTVNNVILGVQVVIGGNCGSALTATSFTFNTAGTGVATQNPATNITNAKLYYTGLFPLFSTASLFGTAASPNGTFAISGSQGFATAGTYYFWLTYDVPASATNGNLLDAAFNSVAISGTNNAAVSGNPAGTRQINNNVYYSRDASVWSNNTTKWSTTSGGPACSCVPNANSAVFISHATQLDVNSASITQVNILNGGSLTDAVKVLTTTDILSTAGNGFFQATGVWVSNDITTAGTGLSTCTPALSLSGILTIGAGTTLQLTGGAALTVNGNLYVNGVLAMGTSNGACSNVAGTSIGGTGSITGSGILTLGVAKNVDVGSNLTISPVLAIASGITITNYGTVTMQNNITGGNVNSQWTNTANSVLNMAGTTSALLTTGKIDASAVPNTVSFSGSGAQAVKTPVSSTFHHLTLSNAGTKTAAAALTINGNLNIAGTAQFAIGANNLTANGNFVNSSSGATPFSSSGSVLFNATDTISGTGITTFNIFNITSTGFVISNSLTAKVIVNSNWINDGDFDNNSSDVTFNGTSIISGASTTNFFNVIVNSTKALTFHATETDIDGDLTVNGTGTIAHNNALVVFDGDGIAQNLNGATTGLVFYDLALDNTGGSLTLSRPASVNNSLTLTDGLMYTTQTNVLSLIAGASSSPGSLTSYVEGPVVKTGATAFVFPVGKSGRWARIEIGAVSASSTFRAEYFAAAYTSTAPMAASPTPVLNHVSQQEYWLLDRTAGTGNTKVTLHWEDASYSVIGDCSTTDLRIAHWSGTAWENNNETVTTAGSCAGSGSAGSISTSAVVTAFSPFTFGSKTVTLNILPIQLTEFTGTCENGNTILKWTTATEHNSLAFILERSTDGDTWKEIVRMNSAPAGSKSSLNYQYTYQAANDELAYYRLIQVDKDGARKTYPSIYVSCGSQQNNLLKVYPNPASGSATAELELSADQGSGIIQLTDRLGRMVFDEKIIFAKGTNRYIIPLNIPAGVYALTLHSELISLPAAKLVVR